jgi:uncharacterized protein YdhG (YjbR/CyaY superfamily)
MMKTTIDTYLKSFSGEEKKSLEELRQIIHSVSRFEECIYYHMPAFKYKGKYVACFRMYAHHIGFYPCSGSILKYFDEELKKYKTSVGGVQLPRGKTLPTVLIRKIIKARMNQIDGKIMKKKPDK